MKSLVDGLDLLELFSTTWRSSNACITCFVIFKPSSVSQCMLPQGYLCMTLEEHSTDRCIFHTGVQSQ
eukprot:2232540-Ditylum_brightwellii.AAC.1